MSRTFPLTIHYSPCRRNGCCFSLSFDPNSGAIRVKAVQLFLQGEKRMQRTLIPVEEPRQRLLAAKGHLFA